MWGQIITDSLFQTNYNLGFPESTSDVLLNLTHWQYWWWYWFTFFLCLYLFIFSRLVRHRTLKFNPKIVTSYRAHGKWGDFIIALLPVSWCVNILSNSNFILRMLEWQTESSLLTIRIRGRQWYWVYKIEIQSLFEIGNVAKNIGHNYWILFNNSNNLHIDTYINILRTRWNDAFYSDYLDNALEFDNDESLLHLWHFNNSLKKSFFNDISNNKDLFFNIRATKYIWTFKQARLTKKKYKDYRKRYYLKNIESITTLNTLNNDYFNEGINILFDDTQVVQDWPHVVTQPDLDKHFFYGFKLKDGKKYFGWSFLEDPIWEYSLNWTYTDLINLTDFFDFSNHDNNEDFLFEPFFFNDSVFSSNYSLVNKHFFLNDSSVLTRSNIFNKFEPLKIYWFNNSLNSEFELFNNNLVTEHDMIENTYFVIKQKKLDNRETPVEKFIFHPQKPDYDFYEDDSKRKINVAFAYSWFQDFSYFEIFDNDIIIYKEDIFDDEGNFLKQITRYFEIFYKEHSPLHGGKLKRLHSLLNNSLKIAKAIEKESGKKDFFLHTEEPILYDAISRRLVRTNYSKTKNQPSLLQRRLLRTRRLLVVPTNINITLITNSFDVVHSWYIPGLGIKMDCIPGRSTHHTLHIDNAGFYYGQCAEICGRFHHHMPIRICALPFEHFLIWWYHYGLPYFLAGENEQRDVFVKSSIRSLNW